tara:strand:- start:167 stop:1015 length:849 start_codon:yes stop_codon:yes gene_type:complete
MQLFVEQLTVIDCTYLHPEHGLEGESWIVDIVLHGRLDDQSMVMDFGPAKKRIKKAIDEWVDHCLLVPTEADALTATVQEDNITLSYIHDKDSMLLHRSPATALCMLPVAEISREAVQDYLENELMRIMPANVERVEVTLREEVIEGAFYHYSHGLKKHDGNCQRIAHGHRSRIVIERNGVRDTLFEEKWADRWRHIYLATEADVVEEEVQGGETYLRMAYNAPEGEFLLVFAKQRCEVLKTDTTVECIAQYIADALKREHPEDAFTVRAYEGVQKGAIASA